MIAFTHIRLHTHIYTHTYIYIYTHTHPSDLVELVLEEAETGILQPRQLGLLGVACGLKGEEGG